MIIDKEPKPGAPAARNKGLLLAKGDWIQFLDADDLLLPNKIAHQVELTQKQPNALFIAGATIKRSVEGKETTVIPQEGNPFKSLFITQLGITSSNLWNRLYLDKIGGWDETLQSSQEADLMFRLLQLSEEVIIDSKPLTIVRERESGQISQRGELIRLSQYFELRWKFYVWIKENKINHFKNNGHFYVRKLFQVTQKIGLYNLDVANNYYRQHLLFEINIHHMSFHSFLIQIIGFKTTEKLRQFLLNL